MSLPTRGFKFIDIGANLLDAMYQGQYHGSSKHQPDLEAVLDRAWSNGLQKIILTSGSLSEARSGLALARGDDRLYTTVGCHPTRCGEFDQQEGQQPYLEGLRGLLDAKDPKVVAVGEFGLDYDRLNFCPADTQIKYFEKQLGLAEVSGLPLFLHCRGGGAAVDLARILEENRERLAGNGGVVHSFDGTLEQALKFIDLGYSIGINGCSLKTEENLEVVRQLPEEKLMLETDCPWCEVRPSHAGFKHVASKFEAWPWVKKDKWKPGALVKSRNEPMFIRQILEVVCAVKGKSDPREMEQVAEVIYRNTIDTFFRR